MKKILFIVCALGAATIAQAQDISPNAIGLRLGGGDGFGTEISYQRALGGNNRLEIDLGLEGNKNYNGFRATGIYQWVWSIENNFNWYVGVGGGVGSVSYDDDFNGRGRDYTETFVFASGQIGIEYNLNIPLQISLDARPSLLLGDERSGLGTDVAFSIRYRF